MASKSQCLSIIAGVQGVQLVWLLSLWRGKGISKENVWSIKEINARGADIITAMQPWNFTIQIHLERNFHLALLGTEISVQ